MKIKPLLTKLGREKTEELCKEKNWELPTLEEAIKYQKKIEYTCFWIKGYANDPDPETGEDELRPLCFSNGKAITVNKNFMLNIVVIAKDKVCKHCGEKCWLRRFFNRNKDI